MEITEVKIRLVPESEEEKLKGYATITFDASFVVKDLRIIQGTRGMIVAMPTKKLTFSCPRCRSKNPLRARYCSDCGTALRGATAKRNPATGKPLLQVDIAHPITPELRKKIEEVVISSYEQERAKQREAELQAQAAAIEQVRAAIRGRPFPPPAPPAAALPDEGAGTAGSATATIPAPEETYGEPRNAPPPSSAGSGS